MFRLLITGSRDWDDPELIWHTLSRLDAKLGDRPATLVHGAARGADVMAASHWRGLDLGQQRRFVEAHPADWVADSRGAGIRRNRKMVRLGANLCFAYVRADSRGATDCLSRARAAGIKCLVWRQS